MSTFTPINYCQSPVGLLLSLKGHQLIRLDHQLNRRQVIQFSSCVEIFSLAEGTPLAECSFDSDWILRTLSPSNESSKDLNLQRINMNFIVPWWTATFSEQSVQKWTVCSVGHGQERLSFPRTPIQCWHEIFVFCWGFGLLRNPSINIVWGRGGSSWKLFCTKKLI